MRILKITDERMGRGAKIGAKEEQSTQIYADAAGAVISLPELVEARERYCFFYLEAQTEHSISLELHVYGKNDSETEPIFKLRFGVLPQVKTPICLDRNWMDGHVLFPEALAGELKQVCHGRRVDPDEIARIELTTIPVYHDISLKISDIQLTDEVPVVDNLPDVKLVDKLGQNKKKNWLNKVSDEDDLKKRLLALEAENEAQTGEGGYPFADWSKYGGWKAKKLGEASGFFTKYKVDGRWYLADPLGYAFFSMGPDCVNVSADCRIDEIEKWMDWLPSEDDPEYADMYRSLEKWNDERESTRKGKAFSFGQANLYRAFGKEWYPRWQKLMAGQLRGFGMNTLGNWSDERLFGVTEVPYVTSLPQFPSTSKLIFRDFPDVLSKEYEDNAKENAKALEKRKDDPYMIGYFLRNEPAWAFVDNLVLADEVLRNPAQTVCKSELIAFLKNRYHDDIAAFNAAYKMDLSDFEELNKPHEKLSARSKDACADMKEFSKRMLRAYVEIPCRACREVDKNHMILGMRWAWISDPDLVTGWENFDVFSINCYATDPTPNIQNAVDLGVDLPVMIGEFHFGALDAGPLATGLEGVASQKDRGIAYRYYCERVAAHPNGVGCHYFQCYDQFTLGRFDGENYNIGLFDICSQPYPEMMKAVKECSSSIYEVKEASKQPTEEKAVSIPMIAY